MATKTYKLTVVCEQNEADVLVERTAIPEMLAKLVVSQAVPKLDALLGRKDDSGKVAPPSGTLASMVGRVLGGSK
jgi:hypothetical protein